MLNINKVKEGESAVIELEGRLDTATAPELEHVLTKTMPKVTELTLNFEKLDYISSAGLRVLLTAQKQMNKQGWMKLIHVNHSIMDVFEITGFTDILTIE